ncbi:FkbM family methyltransferase [Sabulicella glaciei]|uniref:FkbM family methyltransferase n=1 Tax=Sabulicella glaciei TaxID=2984948 RepID=A0ABT3P069_9PROT|nr:FkbM family methyltransferase [Roseococcus sp. MDT2-1-1]MCW8087817.1 FkbM family methyltransferase [Roseococcus sp. MDT2-1-1]
MLLSPFIKTAKRLAPSRIAFRLEQMWRERRREGEPEWHLLQGLADPARAAVDVGARGGVYAERLSRICPYVHCFEPQPGLAADLQRKLPPNVTTHSIALSDQSGFAELRGVHGDNRRSSLHPADTTQGETICVALRRLDDVVCDPVGFLRINVDGQAMSVLRGAEEILHRDRPTLLITAKAVHQEGQPLEFFQYLSDCGYEGCFLWGDDIVPADAFSLEEHQRPDRAGGYVSNFIFMAVDSKRRAKAVSSLALTRNVPVAADLSSTGPLAA